MKRQITDSISENLTDSVLESGLLQEHVLLCLIYKIIIKIYCRIKISIFQALRATQIIRRYKKLKKIHFSEMCIPNFNSLFEALPACADTLNSLRLSSLDGKVENSSRLLTNLSKLIFLEKLDVRFSSEFVDDSFLEVVAKHCKLITSLMIGGKRIF